MFGANYNGKQPNKSAYIKYFTYGAPLNLWKIKDYTKLDGTKEVVIMPSLLNYKNLYIPGDLFVDGSIINTSDANLKKNIKPLNIDITEKLMKLKPSSFEFKNDSSNHLHYGFIANELEEEYPELVVTKPYQKYINIKSVNYLEIVPLLVHKIQQMQKEIDELKSKINSENE